MAAQPRPLDIAAAAIEATRVWTSHGFVDDEWQNADDAAVLTGDGRFILPLDIYVGINDSVRVGATHRIGVLLKAGEAVEALVPHLDGIALVALDFPAFTDGRSYSKAEILRRRYNYGGDIRATGDVLFDQVSHMLRCGFSSLEVGDEATLLRLAHDRRGGLPLHMQPATATSEDSGRFSWRRVSA